MKLVIQIPCYNEAESLPHAIPNLPRAVEGCSSVEWLVVDDGSSDATAGVARSLGVDHIVRHPVNRGLAAAFMTGLEACIARGADIIVNTDADNQYDARDIVTIVKPIVDAQAEMVIGARPISETEHFSGIKKRLQKLGSSVVRLASNTDVADAPSGFRAFTRDAAQRLNVFSSYTYTLETIIQAGYKRLKIVSVPIETNKKTRESRLFKNIWQHMFKSGQAIMRSYVMFKPHVIFVTLGIILAIAGIIPFARFLIFYVAGDSHGHIQSLIIGSAMIVGSLISFALLVIADLQKTNRILLEDQLERLKEIQYKK